MAKTITIVDKISDVREKMIPHFVYDGLNLEDKTKIINDFNNGKINYLMITNQLSHSGVRYDGGNDSITLNFGDRFDVDRAIYISNHISTINCTNLIIVGNGYKFNSLIEYTGHSPR